MPCDTPDRVLMALSGGVDSAVCVRLLQQRGFAVEGLFIFFSPAHAQALPAAEGAARELGIPLHVAHCEALFDQAVALPFCRAYAQGHTPNPCVVCNPIVKFAVLAQWAQRLDIPHIATGHYARVTQHDGVYRVCQAASIARDQSYMLYRLPQSILSRLLLPAGELEKADIRRQAVSAGLSSANAPDSQEICFIPDGDYPEYIRQRGFSSCPGHFIGPHGENLGPHKGILHYTIGQRRGLGVALGQPVFVQAILPDGNIRLNYDSELYFKAILLTDSFFTTGQSPPSGTAVTAKIRSMAKPVPARVIHDNGQPLKILFDTPQRAPAPGQHVVLYAGGCVLGGGEIHQALMEEEIT